MAEITRECSFDIILAYANNDAERNRAIRLNRNIKNAVYPLTKNYLQNIYNGSDYSNLKKSFVDVNCAADVYSYFIMSYGKAEGSQEGSKYASGAGSSGLNPFGLFDADLGFNFGGYAFWLWLLIAGVVIYKVKN